MRQKEKLAFRYLLVDTKGGKGKRAVWIGFFFFFVFLSAKNHQTKAAYLVPVCESILIRCISLVRDTGISSRQREMEQKQDEDEERNTTSCTLYMVRNWHYLFQSRRLSGSFLPAYHDRHWTSHRQGSMSSSPRFRTRRNAYYKIYTNRIGCIFHFVQLLGRSFGRLLGGRVGGRHSEALMPTPQDKSGQARTKHQTTQNRESSAAGGPP